MITYTKMIKNPGKCYLTILCPDDVIEQINKICSLNKIWIFEYGPVCATIEFHSKKELMFFADYFENKFFIAFCSYEVSPNQVEIKFNWDKLKQSNLKK